MKNRRGKRGCQVVGIFTTDDLENVAGEQVGDIIANEFRRGFVPLSAVKSMKEIYAAADRMAADMVELNDFPETRMACREGCSHCCHASVGAIIPEILAIAQYVRAHFSEAEQAGLRQRLAWVIGRLGRLDEKLHCFLPCAFLVEGRCSIYPVRPFVCRGFNSIDAETCRQFFIEGEGEEAKMNGHQYVTMSLYALAFIRRLDVLGLDWKSYDLSLAVQIALDHPEAGEEWLQGGAVFAPAQQRPERSREALESIRLGS